MVHEVLPSNSQARSSLAQRDWVIRAGAAALVYRQMQKSSAGSGGSSAADHFL
jgi:hypothetical protein